MRLCRCCDSSSKCHQVTFDEKSPAELLAYLNEIFHVIDPMQKAEPDEPDDVRNARMLSFLAMLKFPLPENQREGFACGLSAG